MRDPGEGRVYALLRVFVGVASEAVWVKAARERVVGLLDRVRRRVARDAEHLVMSRAARALEQLLDRPARVGLDFRRRGLGLPRVFLPRLSGLRHG